MKTLITFLLFCAFTVCAQDTTHKIDERRNPDGTLRWRIETTARGKTPILRVYQNFKAGHTNATRSYMLGGEMVMMEADEHGDGFFETLIVYRPSKNDMEVFTRKRDGSVSPVSAQTLAAYKKQHATITELWDKAFDKDTDADKFVDRMQDAQRKIRDAEKEKKDEKK
jgi:hypothetical protein